MDYLSRQLAIRERLLGRIKDAVSNCVHFEENHSQYLARQSAIMASKDWTNANGVTRAYLQGAWDLLYSQVSQRMLWVLIGKDGRQFAPKDDSWLKEDSDYKSSMSGVHVWPNAAIKDGRFTGEQLKPWYPTQEGKDL